MAFSDRDLRTLKRAGAAFDLSYDGLLALIARLEAAEKAMNHFSTETVLNDCCHPYLTAWRKAAGK